MHLAAGKPRLIGFDVIFESPSSRGPKDDEALGKAVAFAGNVVLGAAYTKDIQPHTKREMYVSPLPGIRRGAAAVALVNMWPDPDGEVRRVPLEIVPEGKMAQRMPAFDTALHELLAKSGRPVAPLPRASSVLINFRGGRNTFPWVSYHRVVRGEIEPAYWKNKIVLIGPTSEVLHDPFATPFASGGDMPGVEIHANALQTLVHGNPIREVPRPLSTALAGVAGFLGCALVARLNAFRALLAATGLWLILTLAAYAGFVLMDVWMRGMAGTVALLLGYGGAGFGPFVGAPRGRRGALPVVSPPPPRARGRPPREGRPRTNPP